MQRQSRAGLADEAAGASRAARALLPLLAVLCAAIVQSPILGHFFRRDDFLHLYQIADLGWLRFALTTHGGHVLITSNTAFYLCHALFGLHAEMYYVVAWLTHLLNVALLYRVVEIATDRPALAFVPALLWGISGLAQEPLGWFSVYGHVLVATWVLWFLCDVAQVGRGRRELTAWTRARWVLLLLLAATSFGTGIPIAMLSGPVVYLLLAGHPGRRRAALWLGSLAVLVPAVYLVAIWIHSQWYGEAGSGLGLGAWFAALAPSNWWPTSSLLAMMIAYGVAHLLLGAAVTTTIDGVARGPFAGTSLFAVLCISGAVAVALLGMCAVSLRRASPATRQHIAGYAILAIGAYGIVALGRAAFYGQFATSLTWPAAQPRYHYAGQALVAIVLALAAAQLPLPRLRPGVWARGAAVAALLLALGLGWTACLVVHGLLGPDGRDAFSGTVASIQDAIASRPPGSDVRIENRFFPAAGIIMASSFPGTAAVFVIAFPGNEVDGRRVRFVERDPKRRLEFTGRMPGTRMSELLVAPGPGDALRPQPPGAPGS